MRIIKCYHFSGFKTRSSASWYVDPRASVSKGTIADPIPGPRSICYAKTPLQGVHLDLSHLKQEAHCESCVRNIILCSGPVTCAFNRSGQESEYEVIAHCFAPGIDGDVGRCPEPTACLNDNMVSSFNPTRPRQQSSSKQTVEEGETTSR